jgi:geranylgeranyl diphosphate synthase type I
MIKTDHLLPAIEDQLRKAVSRANGESLDELHTMLTYHMGWQGEGAGPKATGKRIRPLLLLITCAAAGGNWQAALPAAAAVELLHNFSLIHDDIEDNSPLRRGRPTLWTKWGLPQALNAGDTLFTLAHWSILDLEGTTSTGIAIQAACILHEACLKLTQGQYLDISYESRPDLTLEAYWPMVAGKTAALLAACTELGALVAGVDPVRQASFHDFGHDLGLAFQAQDDVLGVWGDAALTGKSTDSDLMTGKKSLPVLFGLGCNGPFARRWRQGPVLPEEVADLARQLEAEGARGYAQEAADRLTRQALSHLEAANPQGEAADALRELALQLVSRKS